MFARGFRSPVFEIEFIRQEAPLAKYAKCYVPIRSLPISEVLFSLVWFVLQTIAFAIGAAVYWNRPFDRASQLFYALCLVTLGAFLAFWALTVRVEEVWRVAASSETKAKQKARVRASVRICGYYLS